jgi:hypothetical protein
MEGTSESKLVYRDADESVRAIRGVVSFDGDWVVVKRRTGELRVHVSRTLLIEKWDNDAVARS